MSTPEPTTAPTRAVMFFLPTAARCTGWHALSPRGERYIARPEGSAWVVLREGAHVADAPGMVAAFRAAQADARARVLG